jgi:hypothetical protein
VTYYNPHARAKVTPDPYGRKIGESYRDACERMLGQLRAQEVDLERLRAMRARAEAIRDHSPVRTAGAMSRRDAALDILGEPRP